MDIYNYEHWADIAVKGILSARERETARRELLDHMEDHAEALLAAGRSEDAAREEALSAMGDPQQVAKLLRKAHQPILTRILQVCRVVAIFLAVVVIWMLLTEPYGLKERYFAKPYDNDRLPRREVTLDETVRMGDYTLKATKATVEKYSENTIGTLVFVEVTPDRFWQDEPWLRGQFHAWVNGEPLSDREDMGMWGWNRRLNTFYNGIWFETLQEPAHITVQCTNRPENYPGECTYFTLELNLTGGTVYEETE